MTPILVAFLVVCTISLVLGILLALISHFFAVEEDPTVQNIRECLPGVNCGACGYTGCDDYAAALARGEAKTNLCIPGAQDVAQQISEILGVEAEGVENKIAIVHCNGNCDAVVRDAIYDGVKSCKAASMVYGGPNACRYGCLGFGDCAKVCSQNAICCIDGIAHIDTNLCGGCGVCATVCPNHVISIVPKGVSVAVMCNNKDKGAEAKKACKNACIGCKKCEKSCPHGAITVSDNLASIDYEKCTGCSACVESCPIGCIKNLFSQASSNRV